MHDDSPGGPVAVMERSANEPSISGSEEVSQLIVQNPPDLTLGIGVGASVPDINSLPTNALESTEMTDEPRDENPVKRESESLGSTSLLDLTYTGSSANEAIELEGTDSHSSDNNRMPSQSDSSDHATISLEKKLLKDREAYTQAERRLLVFDYDGTLTPIVNDPGKALLNEDVHRALRMLASNTRNEVWIVSGRDRQFLSEQFPHSHNIGIYGEHGAFLRMPGNIAWEDLVKMKGQEFPWWVPAHGVFLGLLLAISESSIEKKTAALVWHYRANEEEGSLIAPSIKQLLQLKCVKHGWNARVSEGKCVVEIRPSTNNKGHVVNRLIRESRERYGQLPNFVLCIGDDRTDEGNLSLQPLME